MPVTTLGEKKENSLNLIGGPINISIEYGLIVNKNKIKNEKEGGNNNIYLSIIFFF